MISQRTSVYRSNTRMVSDMAVIVTFGLIVVALDVVFNFIPASWDKKDDDK